MKTLLLLSLAACGVGDIDYETAAPPQPLVENAPLSVVTIDDTITITLQETIDGINTACGEQVLQFMNGVVVSDTVIVQEGTAYLQAMAKQNGGGEYIGYCDEGRKNTNCLSIHILNVNPARGEYLTNPQVHRVLTHELGHALGLAHNQYTNNIMNAGVPDDNHMTPEQGYTSLAADLKQFVGLCNHAN